MASPDLQTLRMKAFTDMLRSGRSLFDEVTKETPQEEREAEFEDYKRRAKFKHNLDEEAKYDANKAMKEAKQAAMLAEYTWQEQYNLTAEQSATDLRSTSDFVITGERGRNINPGEKVKGKIIGGIEKFKHQTMEGNLMTVLTDKMTTIDLEMSALKRFEQGKAKYGGTITPKDAVRIAELKKQVNELNVLIGKNASARYKRGFGFRGPVNLYEKMQGKRGTKDEAVRATFNTYVKNIEDYKRYLDSLGR